MNKSMKQIVDELGVDKQQVYRYIMRNNLKEVVQNGQLKLYDEAVQIKIMSHFLCKPTTSKTTSEPLQDTTSDAVHLSTSKPIHKVNQNFENEAVKNPEFSENILKSATSKSTSEPNQAVLIEALQKQIESLENDKVWLLEQCRIKDKQISAWTQAAAEFNKKSEPKLIEEKIVEKREKRGFWARLFGRD